MQYLHQWSVPNKSKISIKHMNQGMQQSSLSMSLSSIGGTRVANKPLDIFMHSFLLDTATS